MATTIDDGGAAPRAGGRGFMADQAYFTRFTIALALFILFGFAQFSLRGFVDVRAAPLLTHVHGVFMVAWLGLAVAQNMLVQRGELRVHRMLGWVAVALVAGIAVMGVSVGFSAVAGHRVPPFFPSAYFLALTMIEPVVFAAIVLWGVSMRRDTQGHRRAMLGSLVIILEPALGRLLPMPLMGGWGPWTILAVQLIVLAILARHDGKVLGGVHRVTVVLIGIVVATHLAIHGLAAFGPFGAYAERLAAG